MKNKIILILTCMVLSISALANVEMTVYNGGFALIKDSRNMDFKKGISNYEFPNVASLIEPQSVLFRSISDEYSIQILEQNYKYDLMNAQTILNKLVGEKVILEDDSEGTLISAPGLAGNGLSAGVIVQKDDGNIVLYPKIKASKRMPNGLVAKPTLSWIIDSKESKSHDVELSYLTQGISWNADYVCLVNSSDTKANIDGWVTLSNNSGTSFEDAKLSLIAGDVRRVYPAARNMKFAGGMASASMEMAKDNFVEDSFFEYHIYKLQRETTVSNNESKQISLLSAANAGIIKKLTFAPRLRDMYYISQYDRSSDGLGYATSTDYKINVVLEIDNSEKNNLGMPLPKGNVKVYKMDNDGSQQFIGEDSIDHTPKDEKIRLSIGNAFDVTGEYKLTNYKRISSNTVEETYEVTIKNHKKEVATVDFLENIWGDWKVTTDTKYTKLDARTISFPITVESDGTGTISYTIRTKY